MSLNGVQLFIQISIVKMFIFQMCCGNDVEHLYAITNNVRLQHVHNSTMTSSKMACCVECGSDVHCLSANYRKSTGKCEFSPLPRASIGANSFVDSDWITMSKHNGKNRS